MIGFYTHFVEDVGDVQFYAETWEEDTGIGDYEFQGSKGHDTCMETKCGSIKWDKKFYTPEENEKIKSVVSDEQEEIEIGIIESI